MREASSHTGPEFFSETLMTSILFASWRTMGVTKQIRMPVLPP